MRKTTLFRIPLKHRFITLLAIVLAFGNSMGFCQEAQLDTLSREDGFFTTTYKQGAREIKPTEFDNILRSASDSTIYPRFSNGKTLSTIGNVFGFIGGFGLGYGLTSKPNNSTMIIVGAVSATAGIVLSVMGNTKMKDAITQYNHLQSEAGAPSSFNLPNPDAVIFSVSIRF